jgi:Spy/CpxP family protein refolding chaperone
MISFSRVLPLAAVVLLTGSLEASGQSLQWIWWKMEPSLALTPEQTAQIDGIFQGGITQLRKDKGELDNLEDTLSRLIETMASEPEVARQIDRVETMRSSLNKTRTLMLLHMRQVLTPDQRIKLTALRDQREHDRNSREQRDKDKEKDKSRQSTDGAKSADGIRKRSN